MCCTPLHMQQSVTVHGINISLKKEENNQSMFYDSYFISKHEKYKRIAAFFSHEHFMLRLFKMLCSHFASIII